MYIFVEMGHTSIFFINQMSVKEQTLIETLKPVMIGNVTVITEEIDNPVLRTIYENVNLFPPIANAELYANRGDLFTSYRFHSSDTANICELLRKLFHWT